MSKRMKHSSIYILPESGSLPSARRFAECFLLGTRQVLLSVTINFAESRTLGTGRHSAKTALPSAKHSTNVDARQKTVSSRLYIADGRYLCRVPAVYKYGV
jgi:hypothetical protein